MRQIPNEKIANENEHEANLERVMTKLQDNGITYNYDKCKIGVLTKNYLGDVLSGEGLKVSDERVKAIVEAPAPQKQSEVRSFLRSVQFCAKFIPNFVLGPDLQSGIMALGSERK